jgi:hypothetical protein
MEASDVEYLLVTEPSVGGRDDLGLIESVLIP